MLVETLKVLTNYRKEEIKMANVELARGNVQSTFELLEKAKKIQPLAVKDGVKIVSFEDGLILSEVDILDNAVDMGERKMNPDGSIACSKKNYACINYETLFNNRYRKIKGKKIQVVTDYRAIKNLKTGQIYTTGITAYEISRNENEELQLDRITTVSDTEFVSDFTHKLDKKSMVEILSLIDQGKQDDITEDTLSI